MLTLKPVKVSRTVRKGHYLVNVPSNHRKAFDVLKDGVNTKLSVGHNRSLDGDLIEGVFVCRNDRPGNPDPLLKALGVTREEIVAMFHKAVDATTE